jgi:hypothetical protein
LHIKVLRKSPGKRLASRQTHRLHGQANSAPSGLSEAQQVPEWRGERGIGSESSRCQSLFHRGSPTRAETFAAALHSEPHPASSPAAHNRDARPDECWLDHREQHDDFQRRRPAGKMREREYHR